MKRRRFGNLSNRKSGKRLWPDMNSILLSSAFLCPPSSLSRLDEAQTEGRSARPLLFTVCQVQKAFLPLLESQRHSPIMPSSTHSSRVAELQTQLEYSAFMTKGVLQTNTELRLQIAELEQQNAALHVAESRLSDVEDQLEEVENRLREKEAELLEWKKQKSDHRKELRVEVQARKAAERERDEWKEMLTTFKEFLEDGKSGFARWSEVFRDLEKERNQADAVGHWPRLDD